MQDQHCTPTEHANSLLAAAHLGSAFSSFHALCNVHTLAADQVTADTLAAVLFSSSYTRTDLTFIHSFIHSFNQSIIHSFIHLFISSFVHSFIHSFIHLFVHSFIHSFVRSFIRLLLHSFVR